MLSDRNNVAKLISHHINTSVAEHFCPIKMTTTWKAPPYEVVCSRTAKSFKNPQDKHWEENPPDVELIRSDQMSSILE